MAITDLQFHSSVKAEPELRHLTQDVSSQKKSLKLRTNRLSWRALALCPDEASKKHIEQDINYPINKVTNETILVLACSKGDLKVINELLEKGANPNIRYFDRALFERYGEKFGRRREDDWASFDDPITGRRYYKDSEDCQNPRFLTTPLMKAMTRNDGIGSLVIDALLKSSIVKTDLNLSCWLEVDDIYNNCTPLIAAVCWQNAGLVAKLLAFGADMRSVSIVHLKKSHYQLTEYRSAFDVAITFSKKVPDLKDLDANPTIKILMKEIYSKHSVSGRIFEVMKYIHASRDIVNIIAGYEMPDEDVSIMLPRYSGNQRGQHFWENIMELARINHMEIESEQEKTEKRILQNQSPRFEALVTRFEAAASSFEKQKEEQDERNKTLEKLVKEQDLQNKALERIVKDQESQIKMLTKMLEKFVTGLKLQVDSESEQTMTSLQRSTVSPEI